MNCVTFTDPLPIPLPFRAITFPSLTHCTSDTGGEALYWQVRWICLFISTNFGSLPLILTSALTVIVKIVQVSYHKRVQFMYLKHFYELCVIFLDNLVCSIPVNIKLLFANVC